MAVAGLSAGLYGQIAFLLARLFTRRQHPGLRRAARRGVWHLHHFGSGGDETRLAAAQGLGDGPEYSPDGKCIYFNSLRTRHMQIWWMRAEGSEQEHVTHHDFNDWFPHISPDWQWMVFLTYDTSVSGHPANKEVRLRLMSLSEGKITVLAKLFGGQGTINVPSWSPDSKEVAFVSYQLVAADN